MYIARPPELEGEKVLPRYTFSCNEPMGGVGRMFPQPLVITVGRLIGQRFSTLHLPDERGLKLLTRREPNYILEAHY